MKTAGPLAREVVLQREARATRLEDAVAAYRLALEEYSFRRQPRWREVARLIWYAAITA